jgi:hypothetical protein
MNGPIRDNLHLVCLLTFIDESVWDARQMRRTYRNTGERLSMVSDVACRGVVVDLRLRNYVINVQGNHPMGAITRIAVNRTLVPTDVILQIVITFLSRGYKP